MQFSQNCLLLSHTEATLSHSCNIYLRGGPDSGAQDHKVRAKKTKPLLLYPIFIGRFEQAYSKVVSKAAVNKICASQFSLFGFKFVTRLCASFWLS